MRYTLLFIGLTAILISCGKSKAKKNIVGTWYETKIGDNNVPVGSQKIATFSEMDGKQGDLTINDVVNTTIYNWKYSIEEGGDRLVLIPYSTNITTLKTSVKIVELTSTQAKIQWETYLGTYNR